MAKSRRQRVKREPVRGPAFAPRPATVHVLRPVVFTQPVRQARRVSLWKPDAVKTASVRQGDSPSRTRETLAAPQNLDPARRSALGLAQINAAKSPDARKSPKARDENKRCKERPDSREARKGGGGSKAFVPWCDRR